MITAKNIASYFIDKSSSLDEDNDLTNLKLQKILYYAQAEYLKKTGEPLFIDPISAWKFGPVIESVYEWLKECGSFTISSFDVKLDLGDIDTDIKDFLDGIWDKYNKYAAFYLVEKTHTVGTPWCITFDNGRGAHKTIPHQLIVQKAEQLS